LPKESPITQLERLKNKQIKTSVKEREERKMNLFNDLPRIENPCPQNAKHFTLAFSLRRAKGRDTCSLPPFLSLAISSCVRARKNLTCGSSERACEALGGESGKIRYLSVCVCVCIVCLTCTYLIDFSVGACLSFPFGTIERGEKRWEEIRLRRSERVLDIIRPREVLGGVCGCTGFFFNIFGVCSVL